jgi:hypothetical protein
MSSRRGPMAPGNDEFEVFSHTAFTATAASSPSRIWKVNTACQGPTDPAERERLRGRVSLTTPASGRSSIARGSSALAGAPRSGYGDSTGSGYRSPRTLSIQANG